MPLLMDSYMAGVVQGAYPATIACQGVYTLFQSRLRTAKDLCTVMGLLIFQQTLDLDDEEATMSEYDRRTGVKRLPVRGFKNGPLLATLEALGLNILRAAAILAGIPQENRQKGGHRARIYLFKERFWTAFTYFVRLLSCSPKVLRICSK
jgi:hypothetical protein